MNCNIYDPSNKYAQKEKKIVREQALSRAVNILTKNRRNSTITTLEYFDSVENFMLFDSWHSEDIRLAKKLKESEKVSWVNHFNSILGDKSADKLKVAYLAGPNPENDLYELIKLGILPENIWAFESTNDIYEQAVENLKLCFPQVKIHRGKINSFFDNSAITFDIVYLDFCGNFFSSNKKNRNIETVVSLLDNHRLNSPGVLLSNYAFGSEESEPEFVKLLTKIVSLYLYPKAFADFGCSAEEQGYSIYEWYKKVENNLSEYYSEFIRRFMMDLTSIIIPFFRICKSKDYFDNFFNISKHELKLCKRNLVEYRDLQYDSEEYYQSRNKLEDDDGGYLASEMTLFSIPWFITLARAKDSETLASFGFDEDEEANAFYQGFYDNKFNLAITNILSQISCNKPELIDSFFAMSYLLNENRYGVQYYSEKLKRVYDVNWNHVAPQACDVFTFQSIIGLLIGQLAVPYHINVNESKGWEYKAKENIMMTDVFVLDECRYIYDMMPTIDMISNRIEDGSPQVCYRFALDALDKNHIRYNTEIFFGCAVVGINHEGFEERLFCDRIKIDLSK